MKKITFIIFVFTIFVNGYCQDKEVEAFSKLEKSAQIKIIEQLTQNNNLPVLKKDTITLLKGSYYFINSVPKLVSPQFLDDSKSNREEIKEDYKITVLYEKDDRIYFKYWNFKDNANLVAKYNNDKVFNLTKEEFQQLTKPLYRRYKGAKVGAYTIPFRLRDVGGDNFDFESSLSLQANLAFGYGNRTDQESWIDGSFGIGLTGVSLNDKNSLVTSDRTASAFTVSLGVIVKPAKYANIGIFLGKDYLGKKDQEAEWKYDGKTWLGLGINVTFDEIKTTKSATEDK